MELREAEFEQLVLQSDRPVLVDFWASWCPPCKMMQPVVDKLGQRVADWADVYSLNIDRAPGLAAQYQISGVPTFISFASGDVVERRTGALTDGQLTALLEKARTALPAGSAVADPGEPQLAAIQGRRSADFITVVSGLPRSGTSMMMRMLDAGGIPALTDALRTADADNPNGYFEFEDVKSVERYADWVDRAVGHSVKMVYSLLKHLPADREYRVIFMRRHVEEILQSQKKMLERNGIATDVPDNQLRSLFERELSQFYRWIPSQSHLRLINISYNDLVADPPPSIRQIHQHLGEIPDVAAMIQTIDPQLYRHRAA